MVSCSQKADDQVKCLIRGEWVKATPEERVRQRLLHHLVVKLGVPKSLIAVEKQLSEMPHLGSDLSAVPNRRADIIVFATGCHPEHELYPLLMIECKATAMNDKALRQVIGYNQTIKSYFIAVASEQEIQMGWYDQEKQDYETISFIPRYEQLLRSVSK